ncbi:hypothetical protein [Candidatus Tisiphia endosymbiont of Nemotelus uliginosus]|uniref:hypothetical protein n=1 Tax=Candidatus Tisiphia endosymbiont of Nemotelus uliginosus TaxID=3077926 RepID=UPI0035C92143
MTKIIEKCTAEIPKLSAELEMLKQKVGEEFHSKLDHILDSVVAFQTKQEGELSSAIVKLNTLLSQEATNETVLAASVEVKEKDDNSSSVQDKEQEENDQNVSQSSVKKTELDNILKDKHQSAQKDAQEVVSSSQEQPISASESGQEKSDEVDGAVLSKLELAGVDNPEDASQLPQSPAQEDMENPGEKFITAVQEVSIALQSMLEVVKDNPSTVQAEQDVASSDIAIQLGSDDATNPPTEQPPSDMSDVLPIGILSYDYNDG